MNDLGAKAFVFAGDLAPTEFYESEDAEKEEFKELKNSGNPFITKVLKTAIRVSESS